MATLLATIGAVVPTVDAFWMQIFLIVSTWKIGALVGAFIGLYLGLSSSFPDTLPDWASQHLPQRNSIVAVKSRGDNLPEVRGILIESAASECREWTTKRDIYDLKLT